MKVVMHSHLSRNRPIEPISSNTSLFSSSDLTIGGNSVGSGLCATRQIVTSIVKAAKMRTCSFEEWHLYSRSIYCIGVCVYTKLWLV
jgi:hypothetical protein